MALGREAIYSAFTAQLRATLLAPAGPIAYVGRRSVAFGALAPEQYPALFVTEWDETYDRSFKFAPARVTLTARLILHSQAGELLDETAPTALNNLADAVEDAVNAAAGPTSANILNGLVQQCRLLGRQVVVVGAYPQGFSSQEFMAAIVLPHSR